MNQPAAAAERDAPVALRPRADEAAGHGRAPEPRDGERSMVPPADDRRIGVMLLTSSLERGGAERQVVELANMLDERRFRVVVCSLSHDNPLAPQLRDAATRFVVESKRGKYDWGLVPRMARLMKRLRIDVVHSFMFDAEMVGRLAGRLARVPAVIDSNRCPHLRRKRFKLWLSRVTAGCFDVMIANSWAGRDFEHQRQGIALNRLCVIPNGVDTARFAPRDGSAKRAELGISPEAQVVGMFAHFRGNKNHRMYIETAARVLRQRPGVLFLCVGKPDGDGPESRYAAATAQVARHGIGGAVRFLGDRSDVSELYNACDLKVLCSNFEGTPNVVLEAMASGLPVIATDVSDNRRLIVDGETGYVVPPDDDAAAAARVLELLDDSAKRGRFAAASRARVEREYSTAALAQRTADVYLGVLRRKGVEVPA